MTSSTHVRLAAPFTVPGLDLARDGRSVWTGGQPFPAAVFDLMAAAAEGFQVARLIVRHVAVLMVDNAMFFGAAPFTVWAEAMPVPAEVVRTTAHGDSVTDGAKKFAALGRKGK